MRFTKQIKIATKYFIITFSKWIVTIALIIGFVMITFYIISMFI